ncbi:hypothetical protein F4804DRAFT_331447 [Jackrogersella minutella]|nr:hypothetical protein F4804DRAFT_331447 [Jackrogersella minutella]
MGDIPDGNDIDISNGTCYYAANAQAKKDYIPCGNAGLGVDWSCCVAGDICLEDSACYHLKYDITYLAGCTDKSYEDFSCPFKNEFDSQQWVGLVNCRYDIDIWAGCEESGDVPGSKPPAACTCSPDTEVLSDKGILSNVGKLPATLGGTISWYSFMRPQPVTTLTIPSGTDTETSTTTVTSSSPSKSSTLSTAISTSNSHSSSTPFPVVPVSETPSTTPTIGSPVTPPSNEPDISSSTPTGTNLSNAAQAGIGVGAAFGAALIGGLVYLAFLLRKRKANQRINTMAHPDLPDGPGPINLIPPRNDPDPTSRAVSELAAHEPKSSGASDLTSPTGSQRRWTAYNPHLHGNYAQTSPVSPNTEASTEPVISPLSMNAVVWEHGSPNAQEHEQPNTEREKSPAPPQTIYELPG